MIIGYTLCVGQESKTTTRNYQLIQHLSMSKLALLLLTMVVLSYQCPSKDGKLCGGHGRCAPWNECVCDSTYSGLDCSTEPKVSIVSGQMEQWSISLVIVAWIVLFLMLTGWSIFLCICVGSGPEKSVSKVSQQEQSAAIDVPVTQPQGVPNDLRAVQRSLSSQISASAGERHVEALPNFQSVAEEGQLVVPQDTISHAQHPQPQMNESRAPAHRLPPLQQVPSWNEELEQQLQQIISPKTNHQGPMAQSIVKGQPIQSLGEEPNDGESSVIRDLQRSQNSELYEGSEPSQNEDLSVENM